MASEAAFTVPRMGSFKRSLFGYRPLDVDAAILAREAQIGHLKRELGAMAELEAELSSLSGMVIEREREIRGLSERLQEANERHERSIVSLETVSARLEEIERQARGQATRIRMKALREAVEVSRRTQELVEAESRPAGEPAETPLDGAAVVEGPAAGANGAQAAANGNGAGHLEAGGLFEGSIRVEIGPLGDFSQLVGFEDAMGELGASEISVERFSEGRATLSVRLDEPVDLLRELEEHAPLEFRVRRTADDNLILDVDDDQGPEQQAA